MTSMMTTMPLANTITQISDIILILCKIDRYDENRFGEGRVEWMRRREGYVEVGADNDEEFIKGLEGEGGTARMKTTTSYSIPTSKSMNPVHFVLL